MIDLGDGICKRGQNQSATNINCFLTLKSRAKAKVKSKIPPFVQRYDSSGVRVSRVLSETNSRTLGKKSKGTANAVNLWLLNEYTLLELLD